jgi:uncharacterized membrane protein (Fun14 family)
MRILTASSNERSFPSFMVCSAAIFSSAFLVSSLIFMVETMFPYRDKEYLLPNNFKVHQVYQVYFNVYPMNMDNLGTLVATSGGGFFTGVLMGWALKKILKLFAVMAGLILTGLAILQYQQVASVNWDKVEGTISTIANATTNTLNHYNIETLAATNIGIPLTSGMSAGFASW